MSELDAMTEAFLYVRDVFRNVERMLLASDPILTERGFVVTPRWLATIPPSDSKFVISADVSVADMWMPYYLVRQYGPAGTDPNAATDLLTIGAVPWHRRLPAFRSPLAIASRARLSTNEPNDVYWVGLAQAWSDLPADSEARIVENVFKTADPSLAATFDKLVPSGRIVSVASPLPELRSVEDVARRLVEPLLLHPWPL